jgi:amidase
MSRDAANRREFLSTGAAVLSAGLIAELSSEAAAAEPKALNSAAPALPFVSALDAARAIRSGKISAVELTTLMLKRIEDLGPKVNAVVTLAKDSALDRAKAADQAAAKGEWWGPFHGVPCTVKDSLETAGIRTTAGAPFLSKHVPKRDAVAVERLKAAGAVILGKTNLPFMASDGQTFNELFGTTNNPFDLKRTPGGSSGGSAAALAAGMTYLCIGSDLAGSIRAPAHFCGIYGHKPSLEVVPQRGHIPPVPGGPAPAPMDLAVIGPLARNAGDLKTALVALGGPDREDAVAYRWSLPPSRGSRLADYRIGYILDDKLCPVTSEVKEVLTTAVDALRKSGADLREGWPGGVIAAQQYDTWLYLFHSFSEAQQMKDDQEAELRKRAGNQDGSYEAKRSLALTAPHKQFLAATEARMAARAVWQNYFRTHDAFLMPTIFAAAPSHDRSPRETRQIPTARGNRPFTDIFFWISFATLAGLPATVAPVGQTKEGLPVGIQIVGPYLEDATTIDLAGHFADILGGFKPPAGF